MVTAKFKQIIKRDGSKVPFTTGRITNAIYRAAVAVGGRDRGVAESLTSQVIEHLNSTVDSKIPSVENVQDAIEKILIEDGHARTSKAFILYRDERNRKRSSRDDAGLSGPNQNDSIPWQKIWHVLNWAIDHRVATVGQLNERIAEGSYPDLVAECNEAYQLDIATAAEEMLKRKDELKVVIVAGPSSSGKTTTTMKIAEHLQNEGFDFVPFHVDNYFFDLEAHPQDEFGDYDYETPQALDLELINQHLGDLIAGKEVTPPFFNFQTGNREGLAEPMQIKPGQILLIDSLHGLYDPMTESVAKNAKFRLYIETLLQMRGPDGNYIRWTDLRLNRRMTRDARGRNMTPQATLEHWHYVRNSELRHIVPFVNTVDYVVNGAFPYELPIWANRMLGEFAKWKEEYVGNAVRQDCLHRSERIYNWMSSVTPWEDESIVPDNALLREFIGGSIYEGDGH
ncbi:MAG: response regulator SirA [Candidatus Lindowbacteria bacterium]|nr:response regulator SirA [Candidatus Lindowbacteria bacterium]